MAVQDADIIEADRRRDGTGGGAQAELRLQASGFLIELSLDWIVRRASSNIDRLLGESHVTLIEEPLGRFVQAQALHDLRNHFSRLSGSTGVAKAYRVRLADGRPRCDIAFQLSESCVLLEAVPSPEQGLGESLGAVGGLIDGLARLSGKALLDSAARRMRALTGCDGCRIALGEAMASSYRGSFTLGDGLGLPGPAIITDTEAETVPIFPSRAKDSAIAAALLKSPPDAVVRQLRDLGARSLLNVPIDYQGETVGVIQCAWRSAREPNFELHGAAELFGQMLALRLDIDRLRAGS
ncbi:MAG: GAF domain-containing protein [Sphingomonas sp.]|nr:GAF domain-containing protein [Sphingomonas sp.]